MTLLVINKRDIPLLNKALKGRLKQKYHLSFDPIRVYESYELSTLLR